MSFDEAHCCRLLSGRVPRPRASDAESQGGEASIDRSGGVQPRRIESRVTDGSASSAGERGAVEFAPVQSTMTPKEVRSRRLALGMSADEFARELRLPPDHVREMDAGERAITNARLLEQTFARRERDQRNE